MIEMNSLKIWILFTFLWDKLVTFVSSELNYKII